mmetsp:Transcript_33729/g.60580  ORF Transcript_33729/g.60580 Transcript_33729/m.60580 type:complete len:106 (+) Transcript_33729:259-576(+)
MTQRRREESEASAWLRQSRSGLRQARLRAKRAATVSLCHVVNQRYIKDTCAEICQALRKRALLHRSRLRANPAPAASSSDALIGGRREALQPRRKPRKPTAKDSL